MTPPQMTLPLPVSGPTRVQPRTRAAEARFGTPSSFHVHVRKSSPAASGSRVGSERRSRRIAGNPLHLSKSNWTEYLVQGAVVTLQDASQGAARDIPQAQGTIP